MHDASAPSGAQGCALGLLSLIAAAIATFTALTGCEDDFPDAWKVDRLRVFAVSRAPASPRPGDTVSFTSLWNEPRDGRSTTFRWFAGCWNPPGGIFSGCFDHLRSLGVEPGMGNPNIGEGDEFSLIVPPVQLPGAFGSRLLGFVFFAACNGTLTVRTEGRPSDVPFDCIDATTGRSVGSDDFVFGYTQVAVDGRTNQIPAIAGVEIAGSAISLDCAQGPCREPAAVGIDCSSGDPRCVRRCRDEETCDPVLVKLVVDEATLDQEADGPETTWSKLYTDTESVETDLVVVADAGGKRDARSFELKPTRDGEASFWLTLHDSHGGVSWVTFRLQVMP